MIPWCFAHYRHTYAKYLPVDFSDILNLVAIEDCKDVYDYQAKSSFAVQFGCANPFGSIPIAQAVEVTVNKDTATPGGTRGFSLKPAAQALFDCRIQVV